MRWILKRFWMASLPIRRPIQRRVESKITQLFASAITQALKVTPIGDNLEVTLDYLLAEQLRLQVQIEDLRWRLEAAKLPTH